MGTERYSNVGYLALITESAVGTPGTPNIFVPLYEESVQTSANLVKLSPAVGHVFATNSTIPGMRSHKGDVTIMCEGNSAAHIQNILYKKGSSTGSGPYTHPFTVDAAVTKSHTWDICLGNVVKRFWGVMASAFEPDYNDTEMQAKVSVSALGSFEGREIATISTTTITLKTDYSPVPNKGLVASDLVRITKESTGATLDTTISSVNADGITVVLGASAAAFAAGDMITLRPATPNYNNLAPFTWDKTLFGFGTTASAALTAAAYATQTRVEQGSGYKVIHNFEKEEGAQRSGDKDPAALVRTSADAELKIKRFFDTPEQLRQFNSGEKSACVIRHYAGSTNQYELRVTFNNLTTNDPSPALKSGEIIYDEIDYVVNQDSGDGQAIDVKVISATNTGF